MPLLNYREVNVFGVDGFDGNPLAVVHEADGLTAEQMLRVANWTNFSETAFLCTPHDPAADFLVRIFTPEIEIPFAGHPTIGSAHAWLEAGGRPRNGSRPVQECGIGLVALRQDGDRLGFAAPPLEPRVEVDPSERARTLAILGVDGDAVVDVRWLDNGLKWLGVQLGSPDQLAGVAPTAIDDGDVDICVFVPSSNMPGIDVELRCFFGVGSIREDPVTGSANACVAALLRDTGQVAFPYLAAQGDYMGRRGRVYASLDDDTLWIAGSTQTTVVGTISI